MPERLDQFREDFRAVCAHWGLTRAEYDYAAKVVRDHMDDEDWMQLAMSHFRKIAKTIENGK